MKKSQNLFSNDFTGFLIVDFPCFLQQEVGKPNMVFEDSAGGAGELIDRCLTLMLGGIGGRRRRG